MIDRLVCADGGNPDPTSTSGKKAGKAKALEMAGWRLPAAFGGPGVWSGGAWRRGWRGRLAPRAVRLARLDGFHRCGIAVSAESIHRLLEPYATSHEALDGDAAMQEETRNVARAVASAVVEMRAGRLPSAKPALVPDPKAKVKCRPRPPLTTRICGH